MVKKPQKHKLDLSAFKDDPYFNKYWSDSADHDRMTMERLTMDLALGLEVARELNTPGTALRYILNQDAQAAAAANLQLIECNFNSNAGIERAKALQNDILRYRENIIRLEEAINIGNDAADEIQQHQNEELQDGVNGFTDGSGVDDGEQSV